MPTDEFPTRSVGAILFDVLFLSLSQRVLYLSFAEALLKLHTEHELQHDKIQDVLSVLEQCLKKEP